MKSDERHDNRSKLGRKSAQTLHQALLCDGARWRATLPSVRRLEQRLELLKGQ
jgi:hypothetical protein